MGEHTVILPRVIVWPDHDLDDRPHVDTAVIGEAFRAWNDHRPPDPALLERVLDGLRHL